MTVKEKKPKHSKEYLAGMWVRDMPQKSGTYHVASLDGENAGFKEVFRDIDGVFHHVGDLHAKWEGWWWSQPLRIPPPPPAKE